MTTSNYTKVFKQLDAKPIKKAKFIKFNQPNERSCGRALKHCRNCNRNGAHIGKYGLNLCRQCFREMATELGFKKYS
ncbi:30S ribosomal protein S14 [Candidatus Woesearchaeota archaeon]|jgi:small subunit ribosomal protein S14|nr:30S ribosomal protein S14 [Candidatus Woesearchaeota archaeon]